MDKLQGVHSSLLCRRLKNKQSSILNHRYLKDENNDLHFQQQQVLLEHYSNQSSEQIETKDDDVKLESPMIRQIFEKQTTTDEG